MEKSIFDTYYGKVTQLENQAKHALPFLIKYNDMVSLSDGDIDIIKNTRSMARSPISELFQKLVLDNKLDLFYFMNLSNVQGISIPELLLMDQIIIDGANIPSCPEHLKKIWINVTPYLFKKRNLNEPMRISDNLRLFNAMVCGALCRSYDRSDAWLNPSLSALIIKMYSNVIGVKLMIGYNLMPDELLFVQTFFAAYYAKLMGSKNDNNKLPYLLNRCGFLGSLNEIQERLNLLFDKGMDISLENICKILSTDGPAKMKQFDMTKLLRMFAMSASDNQTMLLALTYPPYFLYVLLKNLSGFKNPTISGTIKKLGFKKDMDKILMSLQTSSVLQQLK